MTTAIRNVKIRALFAVLMLAAVVAMSAQRRVTPVERNNNRTLTAEEHKRKVKELRSKGMMIMGDTILPDSVALETDSLKAKRMQYPMLTSAIFGVNIWDPMMRMTGQKYGGIDFSAELSLWNRFIPTVEIGMGWANDTPEEMNYTYKCKPSVYGKIGANYNFKFNNSPDYCALLGFRAGYSTFGYEIKDVHIKNDYWQQYPVIDILDQHSHAMWGELVLSIKVKLYRNISAGWALKYHFLFNCKDNVNSRPWYIPGFGPRDSKLGIGLSVYYTLPLGKRSPKVSGEAPAAAPGSSIDRAVESAAGK
ncbi:MAG: DUF6048 family protein [Muribaculaceae bacterium]